MSYRALITDLDGTAVMLSSKGQDVTENLTSLADYNAPNQADGALEHVITKFLLKTK